MKLIKHNPDFMLHKIPKLFEERKIKTIRVQTFITITFFNHQFHPAKAKLATNSLLAYVESIEKVTPSKVDRNHGESATLLVK